MTARLRKVKQHEGFATKAFAEHELKVLYSDGLYRHWRCQKQGTSNYYFDVITVPGWIFIKGDIGFLSVARVDDMIPWCRGSIESIDYFAEKVPKEIRTEEYDHELAAEWIRDEIADAPNCYDESSEIEKRIAELQELSDPERFNEHEFKQELYDSRLIDGCDFPSFDNYTSSFLWCREALKCFLRLLDAVPSVSEVQHA